MWRRILRDISILIIALVTTVLLITSYSAYRTVRHLSAVVAGHAANHIDSELEGFFRPISATLQIVRDWGEAGRLDHRDPVALNQLFVPMLERSRQVSSILLANSDGEEYLLLRLPDRWENRLVRADEWGTRTLSRQWQRGSSDVQESWKEKDYDPRDRPWFQGALREKEGEAHWTEPYQLFTTKEIGITTSVRWRSGDGKDYVVAFDCLLKDISSFTRSVSVGDSGTAAVLTRGGHVVGLPKDERFEDPAAIEAASLKEVGQLELPVIATLFERRSTFPDNGVSLSRYAIDGEDWWGQVRPIGAGAEFLTVIAVPEADFLQEARDERNAVLLIASLAILAAALVAKLIDRVLAGHVDRVKLGQYVLESKIGDGGMGSVYRARHAFLQRPTAVKVLYRKSADREAVARFEREVRVTSQLTHPNTVAIYDYGRTIDGDFYYAMEYLPGVTLEDLIEQAGPLPPARVIYYLRQMAASLGEAHAAGLVHRDVKPGNAMVCERGGSNDFVKVLDFGLVKDLKNLHGDEESEAGTLTGTSALHGAGDD